MNRIRAIAGILILVALTVVLAPQVAAGKGKMKAKGPAFDEYGPIPEGKALVYVFRGAEKHGYDRKYALRLKNKTLTLLRSGGYYPVLADPGRIRLTADLKWRMGVAVWESAAKPTSHAEVEFDVEAGKAYFVKFEQLSTGWGFRPHLYTVLDEVGLEEIRAYKKLTPFDADKKKK